MRTILSIVALIIVVIWLSGDPKPDPDMPESMGDLDTGI